MKVFRFTGGGGTYSGKIDEIKAIAKSIGCEVVMVYDNKVELAISATSNTDELVRGWQEQESQCSKLGAVLLLCNEMDNISTCVERAVAIASKQMCVTLVRGDKKVDVYPWTSSEFVYYRLQSFR